MGTAMRTDVRWSGMRNAEPLLSRQPYEDWCRIYRGFCEANEVLDWKDAGFVRCRPDQVSAVDDQFRTITQQTNEAFRDFLARVLINQPAASQDLIAIEGSAAASEDGEGRLCGFNSFV